MILKRIFSVFFSVLALMVLLPAGLSAQDKKLPPVPVEGNIHISVRATLPEVTAANELLKVMQALRPGARTYIVAADEIDPDQPGIVIGDWNSPIVKSAGKMLPRESKPTTDSILQFIHGKKIVLTGNSPQAALFSVYDFMQNQMGVRWLWAGESGTFYTKSRLKKPLPGDFMRSYTCPFRYRILGNALTENKSGAEDGTKFLVRNFNQDGAFEYGGDRYYGGETIQPWRSDYKEHPEHFALIDGVRYLPPPTGWSWVINGCWSNDGFTELCLKRIRDGIRKNHANHISLHPADNGARCQCDGCKALIKPDESSRFFAYNAKLLRELKKDFPGLTYSVLAYQEYREVPAIAVEEVEFVEYCQYSRCFVHKTDNAACGTNQADFARLQRWIKEKNIPMGVWDYTFDVFQPGYSLPLYSFFADEIKYFHQNGLVKVFIEGGPCMKFSRPACYVSSRLMWDPSLDPEAVLLDYCKAGYGPAWKEMYDFHRACAKAWDSMSAHLSSCFNNPGGTAKLYITPELEALGEKTFAESEKKIAAMKTADNNKPRQVANEARKKQYADAVAFEKKEFARWVELHEKMMASSMVVTAYQESMDDLRKGQGINLKNRNGNVAGPGSGPSAAGIASIAWDEKALLVRVKRNSTGGLMEDSQPRKVVPNKDGQGAYGADSVELFIQPAGNTSYYHFALGANGDYYDGEGWDGKWDGKWSFDVKVSDASGYYEFTIPFETLGRVPQNGETWKMVVVLNEKTGVLGLPAPRHHDIGAGADVTFAAGKRP